MGGDSDDDEFDELFSFGTTPTASTRAAAAAGAAAGATSPINFRLDEDDDEIFGSAKAVADGTAASRGGNEPLLPPAPPSPPSTPSDDRFRISATSNASDSDLFSSTHSSTLGATGTRKAIRANSTGDDSFLDMIDDDGVPVAPEGEGAAAEDESATANRALPVPEPVERAMTDESILADLVIHDESSPGQGNRKRLPSELDDDFHEHDAGTRDFLEWLDDGDQAAAGGRDRAVSSSPLLTPSPAGREDGRNRLKGSAASFDFEKDVLGVVADEDGKGVVEKDEGSQTSRSKSESGGAAETAESLLDPMPKAEVSRVDRVGKGGNGEKHGADSDTRAKSSAGDATEDEAAGNEPKAASGTEPQDGPSAQPVSTAKDSDGAETAQSDAIDDKTDASASSKAEGEKISEPATPPIPPPPPQPQFKSLVEAIHSPDSTALQIRELANTNSGEFQALNPSERKHLWSKVICGKTLKGVMDSSLAESFVEWRNDYFRKEKEQESGAEKEAESKKEDEEVKAGVGHVMEKWIKDESEALAGRIITAMSASTPDLLSKEDADPLSKEDGEDDSGKGEDKGDKVVRHGEVGKLEDSDLSIEGVKNSLESLLLFHYISAMGAYSRDHAAPTVASSPSKEEEKWQKEHDNPTGAEESSMPAVEWDPLLPPVAAALLSASVPAPAAFVMLTNVIPVSIPLMGLTNNERKVAAKDMHTQLYLLACYHLPLLVLHLDRYAPGWHWPRKVPPKAVEDDVQCAGEVPEPNASDNSSEENATKLSRKLEDHGVIPLSWLMSNMSGESPSTSGMEPTHLLQIWDELLTKGDNSFPFFLTLSVLEKHSDTLLMMKGSEVAVELGKIMELENGEVAGLVDFVGEGRDGETRGEAVDEWVQSWCEGARSLLESTPKSVVDKLRGAEDMAVNIALVERQRIAEERLQARLEAEARAHEEAVEAERTRKEREVRAAVTRVRLATFYKKHNPEKAGKVDKILKIYEGREDELDAKLKAKYGVGFRPSMPVINKKLSENANKLLSTMNQGLVVKRQQIRKTVVARSARWRRGQGGDAGGQDLIHQVAVKVTSDEVLPILCSSKEPKKASEQLIRGRYAPSSAMDGMIEEPLKFYLVDSRPDDTAKEQGRFPTAVGLSPEALADPDRVRHQVEMFESLRGAVHICVMGEGFSSFPKIYEHKLSAEEQELSEEDEARTSFCALFFIKKGFPFVSILDGGFASAHAWLQREGRKRSMKPSSVLVDYDENLSLFAQLEAAYREQQELANASTREKTTRALQKIMDNSMTSLTQSVIKIDTYARDFDGHESRQKVKKSVSDLIANKTAEFDAAETKAKVRKSVSNLLSSMHGNEDTSGDTETKEKPRKSMSNLFATMQGKENSIDGLEVSKGNVSKEAKKDDHAAKKDGATESASNVGAHKFKNPFAGFRHLGEKHDEKSNNEEKKTSAPLFAAFRHLGEKHDEKSKAPDTTSETKHADEKKVDRRIGMGVGLNRNPFVRFRHPEFSKADGAEKDKPKTDDKKAESGEKPKTSTKDSFSGLTTQLSTSLPKLPSSSETEEEGTADNKQSSSLKPLSKVLKNPFAGVGSKSGSAAEGPTDEEAMGKDTEAGSKSALKRNLFAGGLGGLSQRMQAGAESKKDQSKLGDSFSGQLRGIRGTITSIASSSSLPEESISFQDNEQNGLDDDVALLQLAVNTSDVSTDQAESVNTENNDPVSAKVVEPGQIQPEKPSDEAVEGNKPEIGAGSVLKKNPFTGFGVLSQRTHSGSDSNNDASEAEGRFSGQLKDIRGKITSFASSASHSEAEESISFHDNEKDGFGLDKDLLGSDDMTGGNGCKATITEQSSGGRALLDQTQSEQVGKAVTANALDGKLEHKPTVVPVPPESEPSREPVSKEASTPRSEEGS